MANARRPPRQSSNAEAGGSELRQAAAAAAERIEEIIDAAERAAEAIRASVSASSLIADAIREEAETEAAGYLERRRREADQPPADRPQGLERPERGLEETVGPLIDLFERLRLEAERTARGLESAVAQLRELHGAPEPQALESLAAGLAARHGPDATDHGPDVRDSRRAKGGGGHERSVLRAAQMAAAGRNREQIERELRSEFGIESPASIVDEIFGED